MIRAALSNPIAVSAACIAALVFAAVLAPRMSVDAFPELAPPVLVVATSAPGMGPKDVEKTITWRIERAVAATPGVREVKSEARSGFGITWVWLAWGSDLVAAQSLVQQQVAFAMSSVPKSLGVLPPFVLQHDPANAPVLQVAVFGGELREAELYEYAKNVIQPIIEGVEGVASAAPNGGRQRQINVVVDPRRAAALGVTTEDVARAVRATNALLPSGRMVVEAFDSNVYTNALPERVEEIEEAVVEASGGRRALLRDVARVEDGGSIATQAVLIDGASAVYLNVLRIPGGNVIEIVDAVRRRLARLEELPPGLRVAPIFDQSTFVRGAYQALEREILMAMVLIGLVILVFLQDPRSVLTAFISIPVSFSVVLLVLYATGQTLNAFTLGGLMLCMGPLVDISVVVLESIHRRRHAGDGPRLAAETGTAAVARPMLAATICTIAVLLPVLLLEGLAQRLFAPLALTVATGMAAAYVVSLTVTPVAARYLLGSKGPGRLGRAVAARIRGLADGYARWLRAALPHRRWVIGGAACLVVASVTAASRLPSTFFPEIDESMERVYVRFAPGTSLERATEQMAAMGRILEEELPAGAVELVLANVGTPLRARSAMNSPNLGPHMGFIRLALSDPAARSASQRQIADAMRHVLTARFPGVELLQAPGGLATSVFSEGYLAPLVVEIPGDDLTRLDARSRAVAEVARTVPGVRDVYATLQTDYPEVRVEIDRLAAGALGLSARDIAQAALDATLGNINAPSVWIDGRTGQSHDVVTAYDRGVVADPEALREVPVSTAENVGVGSYASLSRSVGPVAIQRRQMTRTALVLMQTEGRDLGSAAADLEARLAADPRTADIPLRLVGQVELMRRTFSGLGLAVALAVMVTVMVTATLFESLRLPLAMLFTIPLSLVGIVAALLAAGQGLSIPALMGALMVVGIAVANGILLVDHAARALADGQDAVEAAVEAARVRFVPIAMTSLATIFGLLPTALGLEHGTEANRPLALAVVGGLASSTCLALFLVPSLFVSLAPAPPAEL